MIGALFPYMGSGDGNVWQDEIYGLIPATVRV